MALGGYILYEVVDIQYDVAFCEHIINIIRCVYYLI
jgi:hypothetical protein